jgi:carbon monoxide dehydrogenase subunit G
MKVEGEISVQAPRELVFARLSDASFFTSCIDGVKELNAIDETHYNALFATRIAYLRFTFKVNVEMTRIEPPHRIEAKVEGTPLGVVGRMTATAATELSEDNRQTMIRYSIEATITGKLGSMGEPVLRAKAREMEKQFSQNLIATFARDSTQAGR